MVSFLRPWCGRLYGTTSIAYGAEPRNYLALGTIMDHLTHQTYESPMVNMMPINAQLKGLVQSGRLSDARKMFDELPHRDTITWANMLSGYVNVSDISEALALFSRFWVDHKFLMDRFILSLALKACGLSRNGKFGETIHGYSVKTGFVNSVFVGSSLVDMYAKIGKVWCGCKLFEEMPVRNVVSWTAIISGLAQSGYHKQAFMAFAEMRREGIPYDSYILAIALKACAGLCELNYGREIHTHAIKKGFDETPYVANSLVNMYYKCNKLNYGSRLFGKMSARDVVSWTTTIVTYLQTGQEDLGIQKFLEMRESNVKPNSFTFAAVISGCARLLKLDWGTQLHGHVFQIGFLEDLSVANALVTVYSGCGQLEFASKVFSEMHTRDIISWSTVIDGYSQAGYGDEAFEFLSLMRREGLKPTEFALSSVLSVSGFMGILDQGKQLHAHVLSIGLDSTPVVRSALITMYAKCGSIIEASKIFHISDDIVTWTAMIYGFAEHGYSYEAINLFEEIPKAGLRPDSVTFIGVLSACSHVGLVDLGFYYFNLMSKLYKINPSKEHYGCIIDLLCRAGRLPEAENMIRSMPAAEQDDVVWSILLRSSRLHGDVERGRRAAEQILKLDSSCAGTHTTVANIYASGGRWRNAAEIRNLMRSKGINKEPGWSWVKVKDQISTFVAGDRSHPQSEKVYRFLDLVASTTEISIQGTVCALPHVEHSWKFK